FKFVQDALEAGELEMVGSWFDLDHGTVWVGNEDTHEFHKLKST
ncbi:MAG: carbonic anhydrase, partial [OCS116 cluster bacterium]|nr:carbonic anhydrase [OCS116 cluster bacterium]